MAKEILIPEIVSGLAARAKVLVLGSAFVDMVVKIAKLPTSGMDVAGRFQETIVGGCSFNVADVFYKLGLEFESFMPIGRGETSSIVRREFAARGYPIQQVDTDEDNGWCLSLVEDGGERTFISMFGVEQSIKYEWLVEHAAGTYDYAYVSGYQLEGASGGAILRYLSERKGVKIFFDPGPRIREIGFDRLGELFALAPILKVNSAEARELAGLDDPVEAARVLAKRTGEDVVLTCGAVGSYVVEPDGGLIHHEGFSISVADTIGSGDSHAGGYLAGLACGLSKREALILANAVAAVVTSRVGAACAPTRQELQSFFLKMGKGK